MSKANSGCVPRKLCVGLANPKTEKVKEALINLARTWTEAASYREHIIWRPGHPPEPGIAAVMLHR